MWAVNSFFIRKLKRQKYNNFYLIIISAIVMFVAIGGLLFMVELKNGLGGMEKRLGADMMVVPADCQSTAQDILMEGSREYFYMDSSAENKISKLDGVEQVTSQFYLASLAADCCTTQVEIVGFNPDTDFIIWPWIQKKERKNIKDGMVIVGNEIKQEKDGTIKLFGRNYLIGARLTETGTSLDTSVYLTMEVIPQLIQDAQNQGLKFLNRQVTKNSISSVFVKMKKQESQQAMSKEISKVTNQGVDIIYTKDILSSFADNTKQIIYSICILVCIIFLAMEFLFFLVCHITAVKRKKEYALLHIIGVSRKQILLIQIKEILVLTSIGFLFGICGVAISIVPFGRYFAMKLNCGYIHPTAIENLLIVTASVIISIMLAVIGAIAPIIKVISKNPYTALREEE